MLEGLLLEIIKKSYLKDTIQKGRELISKKGDEDG